MQKVIFSFSTPTPGGTFELLLHFSYLRNIAQKSIIQIFYDKLQILLHVYQVSLKELWYEYIHSKKNCPTQIGGKLFASLSPCRVVYNGCV